MTAPAKKAPTKRAPKKAPEPVTGSARIPTPSQGFYRDPTDKTIKMRRVTTILEQGSPKGGLIYWAAGTVAQCAIDNLPYLVKNARRPDDRAEALAWLRKAHDRAKDERADVGSAVHTIVECHILGTPVPLPILNDPDMAPFIKAFHEFVNDWGVEFTASEMVVAYPPDERFPQGYAGTLDYMLRSRRILEALATATDVNGDLMFPELDVDAMVDIDIMGDTKTGGGLDELTASGNPKGVYPEAGVQMAAYRKAKFCYLRDGTKLEMPPTLRVGIILHLRPEGYRVYPMRCGDYEFTKFEHIAAVAEWTQASSSKKQTIRGNPLTNPTKGD